MNGADGRKRELANFEIDVKPKKSSASAAARGAKRPAAKQASSAKKKTAGAAAPRGSASTAKPKNGTKPAPAASKKGMNTTKQGAVGAQRMQKSPGTKKIQIEENPLAAMGKGQSAPFDVPADIVPRRRAEQRPAAQTFDSFDDFDAFDAPPRRPAPQAKKRRKKKKKRGSPFSALTLLLLALIAGCIAVGVWWVNQYDEFIAMKAVVSQQEFYEGTSVDGVNVSGMTLPQAIEYWDTQVEPAYRESAAVLNDGTRVTASQMGYSSDYVSTLSAAWNAGRSGSLVERYRRAALHMQQTRQYEVNRSLYEDEVVRAYAAALAQQIDAQPANASVESFDTASQSFTFAREQAGRTLNQEKLVRDIEGALANGGGSVQLEIETLQPEVTLENVSAQYGMISSAVTNASSSSSNRLNNIALALQFINGTALEPGESFSFNEVVGKRTKDRGFKSAPAYSSGEVTEEVGGGICQVSTTLFNAVVKADLQVDERHAHSLTVSYVDIGKDAAVDWGNKDLRFTNNSDDRIYICCYLSEDKRVHIGVFGKLLEDGVTITLEGKQTGTIDPETEYQLNFALSSGQTKVIQKGKMGYSAATYKIWWDANGNEIKRELLCKSNYKATKQIVEYGP